MVLNMGYRRFSPSLSLIPRLFFIINVLFRYFTTFCQEIGRKILWIRISYVCFTGFVLVTYLEYSRRRTENSLTTVVVVERGRLITD